MDLTSRDWMDQQWKAVTFKPDAQQVSIQDGQLIQEDKSERDSSSVKAPPPGAFHCALMKLVMCMWLCEK